MLQQKIPVFWHRAVVRFEMVGSWGDCASCMLHVRFFPEILHPKSIFWKPLMSSSHENNPQNQRFFNDAFTRLVPYDVWSIQGIPLISVLKGRELWLGHSETNLKLSNNCRVLPTFTSIYTPGTLWWPVFWLEFGPSFGGLFRPKIEDKQVPGIYLHI